MSVLEENIKVVEGLVKFLGKKNILESKVPRARRAFVSVPREQLIDAVKYLRDEEDIKHVTTISGVDTGEDFEVVYHLRKPDLSISVKVRAPYDDPVVPSITGVLEGAVLYEREVYDMVGVKAEGHPDLKRLILAYDWPDGVHPLRKEWDIQSLRKRVDGTEWGRK